MSFTPRRNTRQDVASDRGPHRVVLPRGAPAEHLSAQLLAILKEQLHLARTGDLEQVTSLATKAEGLLSRAAHDGSTDEFSQDAGRIASLLGKLCLTLEAQKSELAGRLAKLRIGRRSLCAYNDTSRRQ